MEMSRLVVAGSHGEVLIPLVAEIYGDRCGRATDCRESAGRSPRAERARRTVVRIDIVTIFPKMVRGPLEEGIVARAIGKGLLEVGSRPARLHHRSAPCGGRCALWRRAMVLKPEPLFRAVDVIRERAGQPDAIVLTSPDGRRFTHADAGG